MKAAMTWPHLLSAMRKDGWEVEVNSHGVYVVTPDGKQGVFERSESGRKQACAFYRQQKLPVALARRVSVPVRAVSRRRVDRPLSVRLVAWMLILGCFLVVLAAISHGLLVPSHGLACLIVMIAMLPLFVSAARRVS